ncbi:G-type lectin S-receptor-like serine/threonine-protein kinase At5g24080, partial [Linum perenne]
SGGFGSVYKGSLGDGTLVAVKKLDKVLPHGEKEFITEVNTIGSMHHMNLVRLCGYCSEGPQRLLVYEFMKNGSLDKWIFPSSYEPRDKFVLDWPTRFSIAIATAQGIAYFHEQCRNRIIHCDIKPENILLDENFCPKVSDFGLAKLMGREHSHVVTMVRGTRGYLAPEWVSNRPITVKADVYSYGMLLLEIIGGRRNLDMSLDADDFFFPGWAYTIHNLFQAMMRGTHLKAVDRRLLEGSTSSTLKEDELLRALKVAFWCIQDEVFMRPSMGEAVKLLEGSTAEIKMPPMPQTVLELIEEGLEHVYRAMKRDYHHHFNGNEDRDQMISSTFTVDDTTTNLSASHATCSYSTMSPR